MLDAGDVIVTSDPVAEERSALLLEGMQAMGYDALNLGETELSAPDLLAKVPSSGYALVSANVRYPAEGGPKVVPYIIKEVAGVKVAITGVVGAELASSAAKLPRAGTFFVDDEVASLNALVPKLRAEASVIVVLAHVGTVPARSIAQQVPGIDVVIAGHGGGMAPVPTKIGTAYVVQAGQNGENMGELILTLNPDTSVSSVVGKATPLEQDIPDEPALRALVDALNARTNSTPGPAGTRR